MESKKSTPGRNKTRRKQRDYQTHVHNMLADGRVNTARGDWQYIGSAGLDNKVRDRAERLASRMKSVG